VNKDEKRSRSKSVNKPKRGSDAYGGLLGDQKAASSKFSPEDVRARASALLRQADLSPRRSKSGDDLALLRYTTHTISEKSPISGVGRKKRRSSSWNDLNSLLKMTTPFRDESLMSSLTRSERELIGAGLEADPNKNLTRMGGKRTLTKGSQVKQDKPHIV
jgi:hypothetical protein